MITSGKGEFKIKIDIHQVYGLRLPGSSEIPSPYMSVSLESPNNPIQEKTTSYHSTVSTCSFDSIMVFSSSLTSLEFNRSKINVKCMQYSLLGNGGLIGACTFGFDKVYALRKHSLVQEWMPLTKPSRPGEVNGYVQISVGIFGHGDEVPLLHFVLGDITRGSDDIVDRIVSTPETSFSLCVLNFSVHKAEDLPRRGAGGLFYSSAACNPFVVLSFAGVVMQTKTINDNSSPVWNETLRIPVLVPSWDQRIVIEVFSKASSRGADNVLLGSVDFDFWTIYKSSTMKPAWRNIYAVMGENVTVEQKSVSALESEYFGRVLLSASVERSVDPLAVVVSCEPVPEPPTVEYVIWLDVYELSFIGRNVDKNKIPTEVWFRLDVGQQSFDLLRTPSNKSGTYIFGKQGRYGDPIRLHLPRDAFMSFDLFLSFYGDFAGVGPKRLVFTRFQLSKVLGLNTIRPVWKKMIIAGLNRLKQDFAGAIALVSLVAGSTDTPVPARPPRLTYQVGEYVLRCFLYQACNLPVSDSNSLSDPLARVLFAGVVSRTEIVPVNLNPVWCEAMDLEVILPNEAALRPDIFVEVSDNDDDGLVLLSTLCIPIGSCTGRWKEGQAPKWFSLDPGPLYANQNAKILAAFELLTKEEAVRAPPLGDTIVPVVSACSIHVLLVGVRMMDLNARPFVQVTFARNENSPGDPLVSVSSYSPQIGEDGQYNYFQPMILEVDLPVDSVYQQFLEVRLLEEKASGFLSFMSSGGGESEISNQGFGYIHLNPQYKCLSEAERKHWRDFCRIQSPEELKELYCVRQRKLLEDERLLLEEKRKADLLISSCSFSVTSETKQNSFGYMRELEYEIEKLYGLGLGLDGLKKYQCMDVYPIHDYKNVQTSTSIIDKKEGTVGKENKLIGKDESSTSAKKTTMFNTFLDRAFVKIDKDILKEKIEDVLFKKFKERFTWSLERADNEVKANDTGIDTIEGSLDNELPVVEMPFETVQLVKGNQYGTFDTVGNLKFCCVISMKEDDKNRKGGGRQKNNTLDIVVQKEEDDGLVRILNQLEEEYSKCENLVCRVYVYQAEGVIPKSESIESEMYLWIKNGEEGANSCQDSSNIVSKTVNPEFNKVFSLPCKFPGNSLLSISLMEKNVLGDTPIGTALVDIENRWFHPRYQSMLRVKKEDGGGGIPIEILHLREPGSFISRGKIKVRIEIMDSLFAMSRAVDQLPSTLPEKIQLRIAIHRSEKVTPAEGEDVSHQIITASHQNNDGSVTTVETDTHYGSLDGTGLFNWRLVLDFEYPCTDTTVRMGLYHNPLIGSRVLLGEVSIDLLEDFRWVRKSRKSMDLVKTWVPLAHPAFSGKQRGQVEMQVKLLTSEEAITNTAGVGREQPNIDPVLDVDNPEMLDHRNALANTALGRGMKDLASKIMKGANILIFLTLLKVLFGIASTLVTIYVAFTKCCPRRK